MTTPDDKLRELAAKAIGFAKSSVYARLEQMESEGRLTAGSSGEFDLAKFRRALDALREAQALQVEACAEIADVYMNNSEGPINEQAIQRTTARLIGKSIRRLAP